MSLRKHRYEPVFASKDEVKKFLEENTSPPARSKTQNVLLAIWTILVSAAWGYFIWPHAPAGEFSIPSALVWLLRGVGVTALVGYLWHRFGQHPSFLSKLPFIRYAQMTHWDHHEILYPYGDGYIRRLKGRVKRFLGLFEYKVGTYVSAESGLALSWSIPALIILILLLTTVPLSWGSGVMAVGMIFWAKVQGWVHNSFHQENRWRKNPLIGWWYRRMDKQHILHHFFQWSHFDIVVPIGDILFGTYLLSKKWQKVVDEGFGGGPEAKTHRFNFSHVLNWPLLLSNAQPAARAAFIASLKRSGPSRKVLSAVEEVLRVRKELVPDDISIELHQRALQAMDEVGMEAA